MHTDDFIHLGFHFDVESGNPGSVVLDTLANLRANRGLEPVFMFLSYVCNSGLCSKGDRKPDSTLTTCNKLYWV